MSIVLPILGLLSSFCLYTSITLSIAIWGFGASKEIYLPALLILLFIYLILILISIAIENHNDKDINSVVDFFVAFTRDIREDLLEPLYTALNGLGAILGMYRHSGKIIQHIIWGLIYWLLIIGEILLLSYIIHYGFNEWGLFFSDVYIRIKDFFVGLFSKK